jgi:DMSO/TMAO reductase YedYZ molybdopterin-dependent catalytic subunit
MVFSVLHWIPSALAAVLAISLPFVRSRNKHIMISCAMAFFAIVGLVGFFLGGWSSFTTLSIHTLHGWLGVITLLVSLYNFGKSFLDKERSHLHCRIGYSAAILSVTVLLIGSLLLTGLVNAPTVLNTDQFVASRVLPEVEATEFQNITLTQLSQQGNNAIQGTQHIGVENYRLVVTGLVGKPLNITYNDLLSLPIYAEVTYMPCVEGWGFHAKWTGFRIVDLLSLAGLRENATYVLFRSVDGYSTGLSTDYLRSRNTLMAFGINDVTLPDERGFPFQVVAADKYGYKWAKWVTSIEVGDTTMEGYWESRGYSNNGDVGTFPFG